MKSILCLIIVICSASCSSNSQTLPKSTPDELNAEFSSLLKSKGNKEALKYLFATNKWIGDADVASVTAKLDDLTSQLGKYKSNELITKKGIGQSVVLYSFLIKYERQPIRFVMTYYKPDGQWQLQIFEFDYDLQQELREAATTYRLNENLPGNEK